MLDHDLASVQKIHARPVPRIGGLAIYAATFSGTAVTFWRTPEVGAWVFLLVLCAGLAFGCGIVEDFTKQVSATRRLLLTMISVVIGYYVMDAKIVRIGYPKNFCRWGVFKHCLMTSLWPIAAAIHTMAVSEQREQK